MVGGLTGLLGILLLIAPTIGITFPKSNYQEGNYPELYQFFAQQPKDILIASTLREVSDLPTHSQRSILIGREYAIPYHVGYANQFRQRATDLIQAEYSLKPGELKRFIRNYGIDYWLLHRDSFELKFLEKSWLKQYPEAFDRAKRNIRQGTPVLKRMRDRCMAFQGQNSKLFILDAQCILQPPSRK